MRPTTKAFLWGAGAGIVGTWLLHAMNPRTRAIMQPGG
jgi:hypothetical protein